MILPYTKEKSDEDAKLLWRRICDGNMAYAVRMISDFHRFRLLDACGEAIAEARKEFERASHS